MNCYCRQCTTNQLCNVLANEAQRINRISEPSSEVRQAAVLLYHEAREECCTRGIDPDVELRDRGIDVPEV